MLGDIVKKLISISAIIVFIDQLVKIIIKTNMMVNTSIKIIDKFFYLTYVHNVGAAWSILSGYRYLLIILSISVLIFIYLIFIKNKELTNKENITYGILIGGIIGNLIDRIIYGYVIDYLDFYIFNYNYPIFNIADICIVISIFTLIILTIKGDKYARSRQ